MKSLRACVLAILFAAGSIGALGTREPVAANVFCPVTIAAVENLATLGRADTYGLLLDFDPGDTGSVRIRLDSQSTRYALDVDDIETIGTLPLRTRRYVVMPAGQRVQAAWIESTGSRPETRLECPITRPYNVNAPPSTSDAYLAATLKDRQLVRDSFSTRTPTLLAKPFGPVAASDCTQPYAPPRAILPIQPDTPREARAVKAAGTVTVRVDLDETSSVADAAVVRSSGFAPLDRAALAAATRSSYRTETFACRSIATTYQFTVTFAP